jgi:GntR family transcriptional repressor for pyruvate dehydrogenase complex
VLAAEAAPDWPTRLRAATIGELYEVRMLLEVQPATLAAERRTPADLRALQAALDGRRAAARLDDAAFVDADIALHAALVAATHNRVLTHLFAEFLPALRQGLIDLVRLLDLRAAHPNPGDTRHAELVRAVLDGDGERAATTLRHELEETLALLRRRA